MIFTTIEWTVSPIITKIGSFELRWYGLLFAAGFLIGYKIMEHIYKKEGKPLADLDTLLFVMIISTVLGARMGHYFFYETALLKADPGRFFWDMLIPPYQGLASHGATIGILLALYIYGRRHPNQSPLWVTDRIVITVALAGAFIRLGNLMNHEIVGKETDAPWGFIFRYNNEFSQVARHPAQLYESLSCLLLCIILFLIWNKYKEKTPHGLLLGIFLIWIFGLRFVYEFFKENQEAFENEMTYNMGQILSIPAVILGVIILGYALTKGRKAVLE
jgi:phosphatidylglycerol---prolipoprotein diacylglyceryl transferase